MDANKQELLLRTLRAQPASVSGADLAAALGVSTRSVRKYVQDLNERAGGILVRATHRGYELDERVAQRMEGATPSVLRVETPMQRLYYIARRLVASAGGEDVYDLAEMLYVSDSTIEADLAKVRGLLREFDLELSRHRSVVRIDGSERDQRRLVRQLLLESAKEMDTAGLGATLHDLHAAQLPWITDALRDVLDRHGLTLQEYALRDLSLHISIAVVRVSAGHVREQTAALDGGPGISAAVADLCERIESATGVEVPEAERVEFVRLLLSRAGGVAAEGTVVEDEYLRLVQAILADLSERYLLDIDDPGFVLNLSLHVRNLIARSRSGQLVRNPLGATFKQSHPLIHELAVFVAGEIEGRTGISVDEDEIAFLGLHLGSYLQRRLETSARVGVICATPRYYDVHDAFVQRIADRLGDAAVVTQTITRLDHDWAELEGDLVISSTPPPEGMTLPVLVVSPVPTGAELDRIVDAVRLVRSEKSSARIRWALSELLDPRLFLRVQQATKAEALRMMTDQLVEEGLVGPSFLGDVLERERLSPTAFGGMIAVPHSMRMNSRRTAISILISDEPIEWAGSRVHLVALFALSPRGRQIFREVLDDFIETLADPVRIPTLVREATSYDAFVRTLAGAHS